MATARLAASGLVEDVMARPEETSARIADVLREHAPAPDDLARARMERRVVALSRGAAVTGKIEPVRLAELTRSRGRAWAVGGGALAVAAAVTLALRLAGPAELGGPAEPRFAIGGASGAGPREGAVAVGTHIDLGAGQSASVDVYDVHVDARAESTLRFASVERADVRVELSRGTAEFAFHPAERGQQHLTVETSVARVEVVGTVFSVEVADTGATTVAVREGTVRVVPLEGADVQGAVLVHAGERTEIGATEPPPEVTPIETSTATSIEPAATLAAQPVDPALPGLIVLPDDAPVVPTPEPARVQIDRASPYPASSSSPRDGVTSTETSADAIPPPPRSARQRLESAVSLLEQEQHALARPELAALAASPQTPRAIRVEALSWLAGSLEATRAYSEARVQYQRAVELGAGTDEGLNAIIELARLEERRLGDLDGARRDYARYLREAPQGALASQARAALCRLRSASDSEDDLDGVSCE